MNVLDLITILGPTASGKTSFACKLAYSLNSEIISGDSRQVYRGMDIGTGKDISEYAVNGKKIEYHLIDICEAGSKYNIYEYQHDFHRAYNSVRGAGKIPILCGGSGLYIESVLRGYNLINVPENKELRAALNEKSLTELAQILSKYKTLHNSTDVDTAQRAVRAIEIEEYKKNQAPGRNEYPPIDSFIIGIDIDREIRRNRISSRLASRLKEGMIEEVQSLLDKEIPAEDLIYYGLEYKYVTLYLLNKLSYAEMQRQLEIAIHQFAKRQMTWFRGMEKRGMVIHWLDGMLPDDEKVNKIKEHIGITKERL